METNIHLQKRKKSLASRQVRMSNDLTMAAHGLLLGEKRVVMSCVAQLNNLKSISGYKVKITALEFADTFKIEQNTAYEQLKRVASQLYERSIKRAFYTPSGRKIVKYRWVSSITYHDGEGWIELSFSHEATSHLVALNGRYTAYHLEQASALRSIYSWRLLEMFMKFKNTNLLRICIYDFYHAMEVPKTYQRNFKDLRIRVIDVAVKELTEKDNWLIEWRGIKHNGRKVTGIEFEFKQNS
jgi:plasmid replication initiation protein